MSRLIVKNLPKDITKEQLTEVFGSHGELTDVRLCKTKSGEFRKLAFVGFKTEEQGTNALNYLHKSYIKTSKIHVETAKNIGDETVPRPWSKYSNKSSAFARFAKEKMERKQRIKELQEGKVSKNDKESIAETIKENTQDNRLKQTPEEDEQFNEFLKAHEKKSVKKTWTNDTVGLGEDVVNKKNKKSMQKKTAKNTKSHEHKNEVPAETPIFEDENAEDDDEENDERFHPIINSQEDKLAENNETNSNGTSDLDWLKSKATEDKEVPPVLGVGSEDGDSADNDSSDSSDSEDEASKQDNPTNKDNNKHGLSVKMRGIPFRCKEKDIITFFSPVNILDIRIPLNAENKAKGTAYVDFEDENSVLEAMQRNHKNIKGRYIELFRMDALESYAEAGSLHKDAMPWENKAHAEDEEEEPAADSGRLFIRNLSYTCTESEIKDLFEKYGPIAEVHLPIDKTTKRITGIGFVTFLMPEHAVKALNELDGIVFQGRLLHVLAARSKRTQKDGSIEDSKSSYKKEKIVKAKNLSASGHNWNTLFLGQNAVVDVMAQRMNTTKSKILETDNTNSLAVRMALGETQIVAETREFLTSQGVKLDVFGQPGLTKSDIVMLVKNLPQGTKTEELRNIFAKFGDLDRVLLPPSGVSAIVEFLQPTEARTAFRSLAYSKFKHLPLYLEWAPVDVFSGEKTLEDKVDKEDKDISDTKEEDDVDENKGRIIFVKNLNFITKEESIKTVFEKCGKLASVTIARKKDPKRPNETLSMGYGFVEYSKSADADAAIKTLQHTMLDNHQLELKKSHRKTHESEASKKRAVSKKQKTSKILVRNIPFEATKKEIQQLFGAFGEIKTLRLPKKMTGNHRGFVFVDFLTKQDAKRAFKALCQSTHLYGRRLVLEWAEDDETVDSIRQRTAMHFHDEPAHKKRKQDILDTLDNPSQETGL